VKEWFKIAFKNTFLKRLCVAGLLPNVLVWGFWSIGIDNNYNLLWRLIVGPYWYLEKTLVIILGLCLLAFIGWKFIVAVWPTVEFGAQAVGEYLRRHEFERQNIAIERENAARLTILKAEDEERERQFLALPAAEQNRILAERQRVADERRSRAEAAYAEEQAKYKRAEDARLKVEADARATAEAFKNSPEEMRKRAIREIIGGGYL
jgi:hypothetical protein